MKHESNEMKDFCTPKTEVAEYPYGLRIHLTDKELKKLGVMKAPVIDQDFKLMGKACVVSISSNEGEYSVSLQIEQLEIKEDKEEKNSIEQTIYGS